MEESKDPVFTHTHARTHTNTHTHTHTRTHARTHARTHTLCCQIERQAHTSTHKHKHTHTHTYTHTHTHTHTHTRRRTHTRARTHAHTVNSRSGSSFIRSTVPHDPYGHKTNSIPIIICQCIICSPLAGKKKRRSVR